MNRVLHARLRHHSLTCSSQPVAFSLQRRLVSLRTDRIQPPNLRGPASKFSTFTPSTPRSFFPPISSHPNANLRAFSTSSSRSFAISATMNGTNGTPRAKRKQHPSSMAERPQKQQKALNGKDSVGQNTPEVGLMYEDEEPMEIEEVRISPGMADTAEWQACVENVVRNVVSIRFCQTCSFDTDSALTSEATGFVVDAERG